VIAFDDLIKKVSADEYLATFKHVMGLLGTDTEKYRKGGVLRVLMRVQAMTFSGLTEIMVAAIRGGHLDLASGAWLTLLAFYVFRVDRRTEQPASGSATFTNAGGGSFAGVDYPAGSVRIFSSRTGKKYFNTEPLTLAAFGTATIGIVAVEDGVASNAAIGDIDSLETSLLSVTVTNEAAVVGLEAESDDDLRAACRAKLASISDLGAPGAYEWAVRQATRLDGSPTAINRVYVPDGSFNAIVRVVLAGASGAPIAGDVTAAETSILAMARPSGIKVEVESAVPVALAPAVTIWARRTNGLDVAATTALATLAITTGTSAYPIGGIKKPSELQGAVYSDWLKALCKVHPSIFDVDLSDDDDTYLADNEVPTWAGTVQLRVA
jgi:hypothetical protein